MSFKVRFWGIKVMKNRRRPYGVRWVVEHEEKSEWFTTRALAENYRSELVQAARRGEAFDTVTGLPERKLRQSQAGTWLEHARSYVGLLWPGSAAKTRATVGDCLATVTAALVKDRRGAPNSRVLHRALAAWAFNETRKKNKDVPPDEIAHALAWLEHASVPMTEVGDPEILREALDALAHCLDGRPAAANTVKRRRSVFRGCLEYAVQRKICADNPLDGVKWSAPRVAQVVDPRRVPNPDQARALLAAVPVVAPRVGRHLRAFFACIYFAALRPSEVVALRKDDCELPSSGWGWLRLSMSSPASGRHWTNAGTYHESRSLKHRAAGVTRKVPIPPELVAMLRGHITVFGIAPDGRLFRSARGNRLAPVSYEAVWRRARKYALNSRQLASSLAERPYDLRHACLSLWLNSGVSPTEVAERAGHSVEMLLKTDVRSLHRRAGGRGEPAHRSRSVRRGVDPARNTRNRGPLGPPSREARSAQVPGTATGRGSSWDTVAHVLRAVRRLRCWWGCGPAGWRRRAW
jgi:integrase